MSSYKYYVEPETIIRQLEARIAELEAEISEYHLEICRLDRRSIDAEAENARLLEQINTLDAKIDQAIEWQGQAMVRAERAEDLQEKAERGNARLRELVGRLRDNMTWWVDGRFRPETEILSDWASALSAALNTEQGDDC